MFAKARELRPEHWFRHRRYGRCAVLKNNVVVGSVNANRRHWYKAGEALAKADRSWSDRLITRRERPENFASALQRRNDDIKVVIQFADVE